MNSIRQRLEALPRATLEDILARIIDLCFLTEDEQGDLVFEPDKEINWGDLVESLLELLGRHHLVPPRGPAESNELTNFDETRSCRIRTK